MRDVPEYQLKAILDNIHAQQNMIKWHCDEVKILQDKISEQVDYLLGEE